jgi:hypothetical protein
MSTTPTSPGAPPDDKPKSLFDKFATALPIGLTALATVFAGMSTSELQRAMFWRTAASQDQAKATNQWTFAGLKRNRSLIMEGNAVQLRASSGKRGDAFAGHGKHVDVAAGATAEEKAAAEWLGGKGPPRVALPKVEDEDIQAVLEAIRRREPEEDILKKAAKIKPKAINQAIDDAEKANEVIDTDWGRVLDAVSALVAERAKADPEAANSLQAARFALEQRRYRAESRLTLGIGSLYEARVQVVTAVSDRHRRRSENFFYAMLVAQVGAVISTLSLARQQKSALLFLAALVGAVAVAFGAIVYLLI